MFPIEVHRAQATFARPQRIRNAGPGERVGNWAGRPFLSSRALAAFHSHSFPCPHLPKIWARILATPLPPPRSPPPPYPEAAASASPKVLGGFAPSLLPRPSVSLHPHPGARREATELSRQDPAAAARATSRQATCARQSLRNPRRAARGWRATACAPPPSRSAPRGAWTRTPPSIGGKLPGVDTRRSLLSPCAPHPPPDPDTPTRLAATTSAPDVPSPSSIERNASS